MSATSHHDSVDKNLPRGRAIPGPRDICVLSVSEVARLEHWNIWPSCKQHRHVKRKAADTLVAELTHRWVGGNDTAVSGPVTMITECTNNEYEWRNRPSGHFLGPKVRQLVRV